MGNQLFVRAGDEDSHHEFDSIEDAADYLSMFGIVKVWRQSDLGVCADGFTGHNYISIFWCDNDTNTSLTDQEIEELNDSLESISECPD